MIENRSNIMDVLERLEEAKRILDNPDKIDDMILKLSKGSSLSSALSRNLQNISIL